MRAFLRHFGLKFLGLEIQKYRNTRLDNLDVPPLSLENEVLLNVISPHSSFNLFKTCLKIMGTAYNRFFYKCDILQLI